MLAVRRAQVRWLVFMLNSLDRVFWNPGIATIAILTPYFITHNVSSAPLHTYMEIRNCTAIYQCPRFWSRLKPTDDPKVRFCDNCWEQVHLVETEDELTDQSALGRCVAILNLSPDHPDYSPHGLMGDIAIDPPK